ncbi:MAG: hypothetical protein WDO16_24400 [Bacteroidota bacterium]
MRKQLRTITRSGLIIDEWSRKTYLLPVIPEYVYSRHLRRRSKYRYNDGTAIIDLSNGWYIHTYRNGVRMLCALPF